jgi:hypothetical protein
MILTLARFRIYSGQWSEETELLKLINLISIALLNFSSVKKVYFKRKNRHSGLEPESGEKRTSFRPWAGIPGKKNVIPALSRNPVKKERHSGLEPESREKRTSFRPWAGISWTFPRSPLPQGWRQKFPEILNQVQDDFFQITDIPKLNATKNFNRVIKPFLASSITAVFGLPKRETKSIYE